MFFLGTPDIVAYEINTSRHKELSMKNIKKLIGIAAVVAVMVFAFSACGDGGGGNGITGGGNGNTGGGDPWAGYSAGLYIGAPSTLTASSTPEAVTPNNLTAAVTYINANVNEYTLLIDADINAGDQLLDNDDVKLTIIGIGGERTIQYNGAANSYLFEITADRASLTLGQNVTLKGIPNSTVNLVCVTGGSSSVLIMLDGSKITGHTTSADGTVFIGGAYTNNYNSLIMHGGEITGNHSTSAAGSGGVYLYYYGSIIMDGGSITGNTRGGTAEPMDVVFSNPAYSTSAGTSHTGDTIGVSDPAEPW